MSRLLLALVALAVLAAGCASDDGGGASSADGGSSDGGDDSTDPYHVVIVADLSGAASSLSSPAAVGMQTAIDAINDDGGAGGHPIEVTVFDGLSTAAGAQTATQQALAEEPDVIAPTILSSNLAGVVPLLQSASVPVISTVNLPDLVNPTDPTPWFFGMGSYQPQSAYGYVLGIKQIVGEDLDGLRIATSPVDTAGSAAVVDVFKQLVEEEGAEVVRNEVIPVTGFTSYASQAASIVADDVDVVMTVGRSADQAIIVPALRTNGFEGPVVGGEGSADDALFESMADPEYYAGRVYSTPQPGDVISEAAERYDRSTAGSQFNSGWAQGYVIATAFEACGFPCDQAGFTEALEGAGELDIPGDPAFTPISFGPEKHFALTSNQFVVWDPEEEAIVPVGPPVDVSDLDGIPTP